MDLEANKYNISNKFQIRDGKDMIQKIIDENPDKKYDILLDIGCGTGNLTLTLDEALDVNQIIAIDVDKDMIEFAKQNHPKPRITYLAQDFSLVWDQLSPELRSNENKVSLIFTNHCLHWIKNKENVVKNMYRLLTNSGKIYANIYWISDLFMDLSSEEKAVHEKEFMKIPTKEQQFDIWFNLFKTNGFNISNKFLLRECEFDRNFFKENVLPLSWPLRRIYLVKDDPEQYPDQNKIDELKTRLMNKCESLIDEKNGKSLVRLRYGFYQFVLNK